jgi:hypothetical protein
MDKKEICPICYEELDNELYKKCYKCNNMICRECFFQITKLECPLCRERYELDLIEKAMVDIQYLNKLELIDLMQNLVNLVLFLEDKC